MQQKTQLFTSKDDFVKQFREACESTLSKTYEELLPQERYFVLASLIASKAKNIKVSTKKASGIIFKN
jgi:starch phosphorylase